MTRDELIDSVWRAEIDNGSKTIEHHIGRLRKKLAPAGDVIRAVVGIGYRFDESRLHD